MSRELATVLADVSVRAGLDVSGKCSKLSSVKSSFGGVIVAATAASSIELSKPAVGRVSASVPSLTESAACACVGSSCSVVVFEPDAVLWSDV